MLTFPTFFSKFWCCLVAVALIFQPVFPAGLYQMPKTSKPPVALAGATIGVDQGELPILPALSGSIAGIHPLGELRSPLIPLTSTVPSKQVNPNLETQTVSLHGEVATLSGVVPISITETGFTPQVVTSTVGTPVVWTNYTQRTVHIQSGKPYRIYIPLVLRNFNAEKANVQANPIMDFQDEARFSSGDIFSGTILPGGIFTHTFTVEGTYFYFLTENPSWTGLINVEPVPFDFLIGIQPSSQTIPQGQGITYTVAVTGALGQARPVTLTIGGVPAETTWELNPATVVPNATAMLSLTTSMNTPTGNYTLIITGTDGGRVHTATAALSITPHPDFLMEIRPLTREVVQGEWVTFTVSLTSLHGFVEPIALTVENLPANMVASWSANPIKPNTSAVLTITASSRAPLGTHTLIVRGTGGGFVHTATLTLSVLPHAGFILGVTPETKSVPQGESAVYTTTVTGLYDFATPVTLTVQNLPAGIEAVISPNPVIPTRTATITLTTGLSTPVGTYFLALTGHSGGRVHSVPFTLTVTPHPDFTLGLMPATLHVRQSRSVTTTVMVGALHGFHTPITLSVSNLPNGVDIAWASNPIVPNSTTLVTFTTTLTAPLGNHGLTLVGHGGGFIHSVPLTLTILPHPDFAFTITPCTQSITQSMAVAYTAWVTAENDWEGPVRLSVEGLPADTEAFWNPAVLIPDGTSTLVITPALTTPPGIYLLVGLADGNLVSHTAPITLEVLKIPEPDLVIEHIAAEPMTPTADFPFTLTVQVRNLGNLAITRTFQVDWYADPAMPPLTTTPGTGYWLVDGLGIGEAVTLTAPHTFTSTGQHVLWAQVDRTQVVQESDETNNLMGPVTVTAGLPDLRIPTIAITPSIPIAGTPFSIGVVVVNHGIADAISSFQVDWYDNVETAPPETMPGTVSWTRMGLLSGRAETLTTTYTFDRIGIRRFWARVDRLNQVNEQNEANNLSGPALIFVDRPAPAPTPLWTPTPQPTPTPTPPTGPLSPTVTVPSVIATDTTWTAGNVYLVSGNCTVNAGVTLTIEPGAIVKFQNSGSTRGKLTINGILRAQGTAEAPIVFTSVHDDSFGGDTNRNGGATWPNAGDWDGLFFSSTSSDSVLDYAWIGYGGADGNVVVNGASVTLRHSFVGYSSSSGLRWLNGASGQITDNHIEQNLSQGIYLSGASNPVISGNTMAHNRAYAVYLEGNSFPAFSGNNAYGNGYNGIGVYGSIGTGTWYPNLPYIATGDLTVETSSVLTLQPGTVVKLSTSQDFIVRGALVASGTVTESIVFTSLKDDAYGGDTRQDGAATKPNPGDWGTLYFADTSDDATSVLDHVIVRYGGAGYNYGSGTSYANITLDSAGPRILNSFIEYSNRYGLQLVNASSPLIKGNTIWENGDSGIWCSAVSSPQIEDNALVRNNGYAVYLSGSSQAVFGGNVAVGNRTNGIGVAGILNADTTWEYDLPYVVDGSLTLDLNTTLTIQPGVVVKFTAGGKFTVNGHLLAQGDADHRIVFTSLKDDSIAGDTNGDGIATAPAPGDWESIRFASTAGQSVLDYVTVRYGGSNSSTGALFLDGSAPTLGHLILMGSQYRGLYVQNASPLIENAVFSENETGVYNGTMAYLTLHNSDIYSNTQYGLYNANTGHPVNAADNWWGSATGPTHSGNPSGTGDRVSDGVTYSPWLGTAPVPQPAPLPTFPTPPTYTQVSGAIIANTTWTLAQSPYIVVDNVTVNPGVQLTIEPGVVVKFAAGKNLTVNGILVAEGTPESHIIFTSIKDDSVGGDANGDGSATWPRPGDWGRIAFGDSSVDALTKLRYAEVRYGGSTGSAIYIDAASPTLADNLIVQNAGYGLHLRNQSAPIVQRNWILDNTSGGIKLEGTSAGTIADNRFWGNSGYAVYMDASCYPTFSGNEAYYNDVNGVRVSGNVTFNQTWYANLVYVIEGGLTINSGPALTLQPGTVVKFKDTGSYFTVNGALIADGTAEAPIVFTSLRDDAYGGDTDNDDGIYWPAPGDWQRIYFSDSSDDSRTILRYAVVRYGGYQYGQSVVADSAAPRVISSTIAYGSGHGLYLTNQANPLVEGNTFLQNGASGLYITNSSAPMVRNNVFRRNKTYAAEMTAESKPRFSGNTAQDNGTNGVKVTGTIAGNTIWDADLVYVAGGVTIPSGAGLTLSPGAVVKFLAGTNWTVNGPLVAEGTEAAPIVLTSLKDDAYGGDTNNDGAASSPAAGDWGGLIVGSTASASRFRHAVIRYGGDPTVKVASSALTVTDSTLAYNRRALWYENSTGVITATKFLSNTEYALYETGSGLTVQEDSFQFNGHGIYLRQATEEHALISRNIFQSNTKSSLYVDVQGLLYIDDTNTFVQTASNAVQVESGTLNQSLILHSGPVYVLDSLDVQAGITLTLEAGVIIKFKTANDYNYNGIQVRGFLLAQGTNVKPVVFTSIRDDNFGGDTNGDGLASRPAPMNWFRLSVYDTGNAILDHAIIQYAGYPYNFWSFGISVSSGGTLTISNSILTSNGSYGINSSSGSLVVINTHIADHTKYGIYLNARGSISPTLTNNVFTNNGIAVFVHGDQLTGNATFIGNSGYGNTLNGIDLDYTNIVGETIFANNINFPYVLRELVVPQGQRLVLQSGTVLKFKPPCYDCDCAITVQGSLQADGTFENPVVFTSLRDDNFGGDTNGDGFATQPAPYNWDQLSISKTGNVTLTHTIIRYGGYPHNWANDLSYVGVFNSGTLSVSNSIVAHNGKIGINNYGNLTVRNSQIYGHTEYGIYNSNTAITTNAENNWWGSDSGPAPYGSGNGINYRTCWDPVLKVNYICQFYVDADPWLGKSVYQGGQMGQTGPGSRNQAFEAEPVNTANGNYLYQHTDLSIPTRGLPLDFARAYNSLDPQPGPLGFGWTHNWNLRLTEPATDTVVITFGDGHMEKWTWTGSAYDGAPGVFGTLVKNGDGSWDLTQKDQTRYHFTPDGKLAWAEDRNGNRTTLTYDAQGRLTAVTEPAGRTLAFEYTSPVSTTLISRITDHATRSIQFTYNITGELTTVADVTGQATAMTYDANHRILTITDANGHTFVRNVYDANGRVKEQYDALGNKTTFAYDEPAHKTVVTDPRGYVTTYQYDSEWRLTSEKDALNNTTSYVYDADNNRIQVTDKRGNITRYAYDDRGNALVITDTLGYARAFTYDSRNNLLSETDPLGHTTAYEYDARGNLIRRTDALGNATTWTYNAYGQMLSTTDARGNTTRYAYNAWGNQTAITDALGNATAFTYDNAGRKLSETDALGRTTRYAYDAANRLTVITNTLGYTTVYTYDAVGNRIAVQDALGRVTRYGYDAKDRLVVVTDTLGGVTHYTYDANDNRTTTVDPKGQTITYTYDALNRLTRLTYPGFSVTYAYDANGNRTSMTDPTGTTTYTYDALNRLLSVTKGGQTISYQYDAAGNRARLTYPNGNQVAYHYDSLNRLSTLSDWAGRSFTYTYDVVGNPITLAYPNGTRTTYAYDAVNRLLAITHTSTASGTLGFFRYTLDALGHRTQVVDTTGTTTYVYDSLSRLVQVVYPDGETVTYTYDAVGNRTAMSSTVSGVITYTYDAGDHLLSFGSTAITWDANGNMLTKGSTAYTYDAANRLTQVVSGTTTVQFTYDGSGNRASKTVNGAATSYLYDPVPYLAEVLVEDAEGQLILYLYGANLIARIGPDGLPTYYHQDGLGSIRLLSNVSGQLITTYSYDAFGALRTAIGSPDNVFRFTGAQFDDETGLIYLRARYYDPALGRFITQDRFAGFTENPQSHNRYVYSQNNPVNLTDPSGEFAIAPFLAGYGVNILKSVVTAEARVLFKDIVTGKWSGTKAYLDAAKDGVITGLAMGWIPGPAGEIIRKGWGVVKWTGLFMSLSATPVGEEYEDPSSLPYRNLERGPQQGKTSQPVQPPSRQK